MSNLHLVTGYAGQAHVTAADDGSFNTVLFGSGQYVFDIGSKFAASVVSNNKITIADGDLLMQGRHVRLNEGTTVDLTINNGAQGKLRNDLIVARYTKDSVSGVEQVNLVVIQGTAVDSNPADPEYTSGDIINDHALLNDMPLYRVPLNGLTVGTPVALFSLASFANGGAGANDFLNLLHPIGSIYISVTSTSPASLFGGTWERIKDVFLLAAGDTYAAGTTGGEAEHKLTEAELPSVSGSALLRPVTWQDEHYSAASTVNGAFSKKDSTKVSSPAVSVDAPGSLLTYSFGADAAHNNMPPYLAVYCWKRMA